MDDRRWELLGTNRLLGQPSPVLGLPLSFVRRLSSVAEVIHENRR